MIISAGGVVLKERKVLLLRTRLGRWVLPKGHVEPDETLRQAALREVYEEAGVQARIHRRLGWKYFQFHVHGKYQSKRVLWFLMEEVSGEPRPLRKEGFVDVAYMPEEKLEKLNMHSSELSIVRKALRQEAECLTLTK